MKCTQRHLFQAGDDWQCPSCGISGLIEILESSRGTEGCGHLHTLDMLHCTSCRWKGFGKDLVGKASLPLYKESLKDIPTVIDNLRNFAQGREDDLGFVSCIAAAKMLEGLSSSQKIVRINVEGGVADVEECPAGIEVIIKDYDGDGVDDERLKEDERGDYLEIRHGGDSS